MGRVGKWDVGFLNIQTAKIDSVNSTNFGVVRVRRQVLNPFTYVGAIVTNKVDDAGNYNTGVGVDGVFRLSTNDYMNVSYAQTYSNAVNPSPFDPRHTNMRIAFVSRSNKGFGYNVPIRPVEEDPGVPYNLDPEHANQCQA